jgi:hypothetical protein
MDSSKQQLKQGELNLNAGSNARQQFGKQIKSMPPGRIDFYSMLGEYKIIPHTKDEGVDVGVRPVTKEKGPRSESEIVWYDHSDTPKERGIDKAKRQIEHILESTDKETMELMKLIAYMNSTREELDGFVRTRSLAMDYNAEIIHQTVMSLRDELKLNRTFFKAKAKRMLDEILSEIDEVLDKGKAERLSRLEKIPSGLALVIPVLNERIRELPEIAKYNLKKLELIEELDFREKKRDMRLGDILVWCASRMESIEERSADRRTLKGKIEKAKETRSLRDLEMLYYYSGWLPYEAKNYMMQAIHGLSNDNQKHFEKMMDKAVSVIDRWILENETRHRLSSGRTIVELMWELACELEGDRGPRRKSVGRMLHDAVKCYQSERKKSAAITMKAAETLMGD